MSKEVNTTIFTEESKQELTNWEKIDRLEAEIENVREEDWSNNWKQYFKPLKVGEKLLIKPSWEEYKNTDNRIVLEIDPASSFGTGQHNTTRLCLELLEKSMHEGDRILDMGCGSGILSIGAMLMGADSVTAVDIEQNAVETASENAQKNNIPFMKYTAYCGDVISNKELDKGVRLHNCSRIERGLIHRAYKNVRSA